jgi:subtilase family serine protease
MRTRRRLRPALDRLDDRCLLSGLTPAQLTHAYGLDAVRFTSLSGASVKGDGTGQTIALVEAYHDSTLAGDLRAFDQAYNLPDPALDLVNLGGAKSNPAWSLEESLDVEWAHAIAPGANIVVVEAGSQNLAALQAAINTARKIPTVDVVSMSLGFPESTYHGSLPLTTPPGHIGITFVGASGDSGLAAGSDWPAVSPDVLAVGGTTLYVGASGQYLSEVAWSGSGGGQSHFVAEPGYQRSVSASGRRLTPDVAFDGDPNTGVEVYQTSPYTGIGSWQVVGGTSLGTPAWAAIIAIADQGRALLGKGSLDGPSQTLPTLYSLPASDFHGVASYRPGHAALMGLGSPNGPALIAGLVASNIDVPLSTSSVSRAAFRAIHIGKARRKAIAPHHRRHAASRVLTPALPRHRPSPAAAHVRARPTLLVAHPLHRIANR